MDGKFNDFSLNLNYYALARVIIKRASWVSAGVWGRDVFPETGVCPVCRLINKNYLRNENKDNHNLDKGVFLRGAL